MSLLVINSDKELTIDHDFIPSQMEDSGRFEAGGYSISAKIR